MSKLYEDKIGCKLNHARLNASRLIDPDQPVISGHIFETTEMHEGVTVFVNKCEKCGEVSLSWMKPGPMLEHAKSLAGYPFDRAQAALYAPIKSE